MSLFATAVASTSELECSTFHSHLNIFGMLLNALSTIYHVKVY